MSTPDPARFRRLLTRLLVAAVLLALVYVALLVVMLVLRAADPTPVLDPLILAGAVGTLGSGLLIAAVATLRGGAAADASRDPRPGRVGRARRLAGAAVAVLVVGSFATVALGFWVTAAQGEAIGIMIGILAAVSPAMGVLLASTVRRHAFAAVGPAG
jgi:hypothetical protein